MIGGMGLTGILVQQGACGRLAGGARPRVAGGGPGAGRVLVLSWPGADGSGRVTCYFAGIGEPENSSTTGMLSAGWHMGGSAYQE